MGTGLATNPNAPGTPFIISTASSRASTLCLGPYYTLKSVDLGGGAVGLVPFQLKRDETVPWSTCQTVPCTVCTSAGCGPNGMPILSNEDLATGIQLPFYGPPLPNPAAGLVLHLKQGSVQGYPYGPDLGAQLVTTVGGGPTPATGFHTLTVSATGLPAGRYILYHPGNEAGLLCDDLLTGAQVPVAAFSYHFVLKASPNTGGDASCTDYNGDGDSGTDDDIEDFFACLAGSGTCCAGCITDLNCDGDPGTDADIETFFYILGSGLCSPGCDP